MALMGTQRQSMPLGELQWRRNSVDQVGRPGATRLRGQQ